MLSSVVLLCLTVAPLSSAQLALDIYYESLCPDSTRFIAKQLGPMYEALGSDQGLNVTFNPYGFATVKADDLDSLHYVLAGLDYGGRGRLRVRVSARTRRVLREHRAGLHHRPHRGQGHPGRPHRLHDEQPRPQHRRAGLLPADEPGLPAHPGQ